LTATYETSRKVACWANNLGSLNRLHMSVWHFILRR